MVFPKYVEQQTEKMILSNYSCHFLRLSHQLCFSKIVFFPWWGLHFYFLVSASASVFLNHFSSNCNKNAHWRKLGVGKEINSLGSKNGTSLHLLFKVLLLCFIPSISHATLAWIIFRNYYFSVLQTSTFPCW